MSSVASAELTHRVVNWIENKARELNVSVNVHSGSLLCDDNRVHVPVAVTQDGDAFDRATWLQQIQDAWDSEGFGGLRLLLVPTKPTGPTIAANFDAQKGTEEALTPQARARAYRAWAGSHSCSIPLLSDEAIRRESIYGERG